MLPHDKFAAYLIHKAASPVAKYYPVGVPISARDEIKYRNIPIVGMKKSRAWLKANDLLDFAERAKELYSIWQTPVSRCIIMIGVMRKRRDTLELLEHHGQWSISENDLAYYKSVFFDVDGWSGTDYSNYLNRFELDTLDYAILKLIFSNVPDEVIFERLGVHIQPVSHKEMIERMMLRAYNEFVNHTGKEAIDWGKFAKDLALSSQSPLFSEKKKDLKAEILSELESYTPEMSHILESGSEII
jgi:hypothetical protein